MQLHDLSHEQLFQVFQSGFACLGENSPLHQKSHSNFDYWYTRYSVRIWPKGSVKFNTPPWGGQSVSATESEQNTIAYIGYKEDAPHSDYLHFDSGPMDFNHVAAVLKLVEFGVINGQADQAREEGRRQGWEKGVKFQVRRDWDNFDQRGEVFEDDLVPYNPKYFA